ncbi:MAG: FHA domain-containing protein [Chloroflexi bacterium]|nr:FHA domain-containing protein [Chloroflexota bacterium]
MTKLKIGPEAITVTLRTGDVSAAVVDSMEPSLIPVDGVSFYVLRLGKAMIVHPEGDFFIGRSVSNDQWPPQINLAEMDNFSASVSRWHAMIHPVKGGFEIIDLFSSNGTKLDGRRLIPNKAYPLPSGAELSIGRERLKVIYGPI